MNSRLSNVGWLVKVRPMRSSLLPRILLILALLFAQLGGLAHGISHALAEQSTRSDQSLPHDKHCDLCAAYAQIGGALASHAIPFALPEQTDILALTSPHTFHSNTFAAFAARAPPYSA